MLDTKRWHAAAIEGKGAHLRLARTIKLRRICGIFGREKLPNYKCGHIRCMYMVLTNPRYICTVSSLSITTVKDRRVTSESLRQSQRLQSYVNYNSERLQSYDIVTKRKTTQG